MSTIFIVVPFKEIPAIVPHDWTLASVGGYMEHLRPLSEEKLLQVLEGALTNSPSIKEAITNAINKLKDGK